MRRLVFVLATWFPLFLRESDHGPRPPSPSPSPFRFHPPGCAQRGSSVRLVGFYSLACCVGWFHFFQKSFLSSSPSPPPLSFPFPLPLPPTWVRTACFVCAPCGVLFPSVLCWLVGSTSFKVLLSSSPSPPPSFPLSVSTRLGMFLSRSEFILLLIIRRSCPSHQRLRMQKKTCPVKQPG
jgi:hypothetical protein